MISKQELADQLRDDRSKANRAHGDGAWDVANVMAIVWPEIERLQKRISASIFSTYLYNKIHKTDD